MSSSSRRTRALRSSSLGEVGVFDTVPKIDPSVPNWKKRRHTATAAAVVRSNYINVLNPVAEKKGLMGSSNQAVMAAKQGPESGILTLGSPMKEDDDDQFVDENYGCFLEYCSFCKRQIVGTKDVFMYGYLKAFCTPECREAQIALDESVKPPSPQPARASAIAKLVAAGKAAESAKAGSVVGSNVGKRTVPMFK